MCLAGLMFYANTVTAKAYEQVATPDTVAETVEGATTGSAVETEITEPITEKVEEVSEEEAVDAEEETEELDISDDETPEGEAGAKDKTLNKKTETKKTKQTADKKKETKVSAKSDSKSKDVIKYTDEEFKILVCVTFLEAGNQSYRGKLATANAVINRVLSKNFPNTIKGVIYQKYNGRYQFSLFGASRKLEKAMASYGKNTGWRAEYEKACIKVCKDALAGKTATDKKYHFFRLHYKGIENWKPDGVKIDDTYFYNY